ncbi:unnamed protein product, partial [Symbiodinium necroappetens]
HWSPSAARSDAVQPSSGPPAEAALGSVLASEARATLESVWPSTQPTGAPADRPSPAIAAEQSAWPSMTPADSTVDSVWPSAPPSGATEKQVRPSMTPAEATVDSVWPSA